MRTNEYRGLAAAILLSIAAAPAATAQSPVTLPLPGKALAGLRPHPRLLIGDGGFAALKARVQSEPVLKGWYAKTKTKADGLLAMAPSKYSIPDGLRLLATSRQVLDRVYALCLAYRIEGDPRYAQRAWTELDSAAVFPDWNAQRHFLDVGEMTHAFAIGYDWLYDWLSPAQRQTLRKAITAYAFQPAFNAFRTKAFWVTAKHNWNMVCNGGLAMGALAIGDEEPLADSLLLLALGSLRNSGSIEEFGPDGGWGEGPGYWGYAMQYLSTLLGGLNTALGTDFGFSRIQGVDQAGFFPLYATGPTGKSFNYADAGEGAAGGAGMFLLADLYGQPAFSGYQQAHTSSGEQELIWYTPGKSPKEAGLPLDRLFRHAEVSIHRGAWDDPDAAFLGFKGGDNKFNHSHLDLGSFVFDANGQRWAGLMGSDDYNLPGYFSTGSQRWTYYRLRAEGNNTLILDPDSLPDQDPKGAGKITAFHAASDEAYAIADLTSAYARHAQKARRGAALIHGRKWLLIQDEVQAAKPAEAWWFMHTKAALALAPDSVTATLTLGGKRAVARILAPANARFSIRAAKPLPTSPNPAGQNANAGWSKLAVHLTGVKDLRLAIVLVPLASGENPPAAWPPVYPLDQGWPTGATAIRPPTRAPAAGREASLRISAGVPAFMVPDRPGAFRSDGKRLNPSLP
jgi:hypothetical protein